MRHLLTCVLLVAAVAIVAQTARADVFASGIRFTNPDDSPYDGNPADGTPVKIHFLLNDTATVVTIRLHNATGDAVVHTIMQNNLSAGWHSATWDGTGSGGSGEFYVTVETTQPSYSSTAYSTYTFVATGANGQNIFSRGVDVVRNMTSPYYGYAYTANAGGPLLRGLCLYSADGAPAGTTPGSPVLEPSLSVDNGGVTPWTATLYAPVFATTDAQGRVYVSDWDAGTVYRIDSPGATPRAVVRGLTGPSGLAARGEGSSFSLYIAAGKQVVRADLGTADSLMGAVTVVASLDSTAHDVALDDEGFLYVNTRGGTGFDGDGRSWTEQYDISGTLPVTSSSKVWVVTWNGNASGLAVSSGPSTSVASDDILYVCIRGNGVDTEAPGIHELAGIHDAFGMTVKPIFKPDDILSLGSGGGNVSSRCDVTVDPAGNVLFWENGNEEIIMLAPPSSAATRTHTTKSSGTITTGATSVATDRSLPTGFVLAQNYPNPFNPTTNITFELDSDGPTMLRIFDMLGREVATLVNRDLASGSYQFAFDGRGLESGTYLYVLQHNGQVQSRKMMLVK